MADQEQPPVPATLREALERTTAMCRAATTWAADDTQGLRYHALEAAKVGMSALQAMTDPPVPAGERREALDETAPWFRNLNEGVRQLVFEQASRQTRQHLLAAIDEAIDRLRALPAARPEPPTLLYECEFVSVSAIRALIQQWRAQMGASWPERAATLDQCADELDAICPAPAAEEETR